MCCNEAYERRYYKFCLNVLLNVGYDDDEHIGADIFLSVLEFVSLVPVDAVDDMV